MTSIDSLPTDVLECIFSKVNTTMDLMAAECVCRSWRVAARPAHLWCNICLTEPIRGRLTNDRMHTLLLRADGSLTCLSICKPDTTKLSDMTNHRGVTYAGKYSPDLWAVEERHMLRECRSLTPDFLPFILEASRHKRLTELDFTGCWRIGVAAIADFLSDYRDNQEIPPIPILKMNILYDYEFDNTDLDLMRRHVKQFFFGYCDDACPPFSFPASFHCDLCKERSCCKECVSVCHRCKNYRCKNCCTRHYGMCECGSYFRSLHESGPHEEEEEEEDEDDVLDMAYEGDYDVYFDEDEEDDDFRRYEF